MGRALKDASSEVYVSKALPNGAATTVSDGINLKNGTKGDFLAECELLIESPAVPVALADAQTLTFDVYHDTSSAFGGETLLFDNVITQTGAGGAGAAAASVRLRLPVDVKQHLRVKATKSGAGDLSGYSFTARLVF